MRILAVTNMYPSAALPAEGVFIAEQVKGLRAIGVEVAVHLVERRNRGMGVYHAMMKPIRELIHQFRPEVLHIMYGGVMADRLTRKLRHVPRVVTFHGSDLLGENFSGWRRKLIARYGVWCSHRAAKRADGVVVVSRQLKEALPAGLDSRKVRVIPCGIDLQRFGPLDQAVCRQQLGWSPGLFHVLFPAHRTNWVKRPALALRTLDRLKAAGLATELHFLEQVPNELVPVWMNASDALLLTSAHEGSPTVVKEALACGLPVVSVDVGDVAERLHGVEGCYLAAAAPAELAARLLLVQRRGSRVVAAEKLSELGLEGIARQLASHYRELLPPFQPDGTPQWKVGSCRSPMGASKR